MAVKMRRPRGEGAPPPVMTDAEIAKARSDQLEARRAEHEAHVARIAATDPGRSLPPTLAEQAREGQLREIEAHVSESERLATAAGLRAEQERQASGVGRIVRRTGLLKAAADDPDAKEFSAKLREASLAREREQEAKRRIAEIGEKRKHPPDPRARSVAAAVLSDATLYELLTRRLREIEGVDELGKRIMSAEPVFEYEDIGVLAVALALLSERNPVLISTSHVEGSWPAWSELPPIPKLLERIGHLARNGWLAVSSDSGGRSVTYGPEALRAAREAGVNVTAA